MAWLAVDKDGSEYIYENEPIRDDYSFIPIDDGLIWDDYPFIELPKGTIEKILGRKLTFDDGAVNIK